MPTSSFSTASHRAFQVLSPLPHGKHVPTGYLTNTLKRGGHPYGIYTRLQARQDNTYSAAKMAEESREALEAFTSLNATPLHTTQRQQLNLALAGEVGNLKAKIAYLRMVYPRLPKPSRHAPAEADPDILRHLSKRWESATRFAMDTVNTDKDVTDLVKETTVHTEEMLHRFFMLPATCFHLSDVEHAMRARQQAFGLHEGWTVSAMVLNATDDLCNQLATNKGWQETDPSAFAIDDALTFDRIYAVTPGG